MRSDAGETAGTRMRWSVERRLEFIEFRFYWEGRVNRSDLVDFFAVSIPQASADLARYQQFSGTNLTYDKTVKCYVATPEFHPVLFEPSADKLLARLRSFAGSSLDKEDLWLDQVPPLGAVPLLRRRVEPGILRQVLQACRSRLRIHIEYQSVSSGGPKWRWIAPHAIGFDGFRWHARAWCYDHREFRDFVLARIMQCSETENSKVDGAQDAEWHQEVTLRLAPNPGLAEGIRRAIEMDYGMVDGVIEVTTRIALSSYFERLHGLDLDPTAIPEYRQQLVVINRDEVASARRRAREASLQQVERDE